MSELLLISLNQCGYSIAAKETLDNHKIKYKYKLIYDNEKENYKTKEIRTFPQLYLIKKNDKKLIGGYDDIDFILKTINKSKYNKKEINKLFKKYKDWKHKDVLRLITLFSV